MRYNDTYTTIRNAKNIKGAIYLKKWVLTCLMTAFLTINLALTSPSTSYANNQGGATQDSARRLEQTESQSGTCHLVKGKGIATKLSRILTTVL